MKENTLNMANNTKLVARLVFSEVALVTDRFYVVKLVLEAVQHLRIKCSRQEIDKKNQAIKIAKEQNLKYTPCTFENEDSPKRLLARSRFIIAKKESQWTQSQKEKQKILFLNYPSLEQAYNHTMEFRNIYELTSKSDAKQKILS